MVEWIKIKRRTQKPSWIRFWSKWIAKFRDCSYKTTQEDFR